MTPRPKPPKVEVLRVWGDEEADAALARISRAFGAVGAQVDHDEWVWVDCTPTRKSVYALPRQLVAVQARYKLRGSARRTWDTRIVLNKDATERAVKAAMRAGADQVKVMRAELTWVEQD